MEEKKLYEICFWLKDKGDDTLPKEDLQKISQAIINAGGSVVSEKSLEKRNLAYPIKKQKAGFWGEIQFSGMPSILEVIRKVLQYDNEILRKMVFEVKKSKKIKKMRTAVEERSSRKSELAASELSRREEKPQVSQEALDTKLKEILEG